MYLSYYDPYYYDAYFYRPQEPFIHRFPPPSQPKSLQKSAENNKQLLSDVELINETIRTSPAFAQRLVNAAQQSDTKAVQSIINQLPLKHKTAVAISPGGISITFMHKESDCCYVVMFLNWRDFF